jgi:S1-C subfamily serine protease
MADSTQVKVGQLAVALGNPFGLEGSMTVGFISALGRLLPTQTESDEPSFTIPDVLQTDAPINPGNSGGVLANSAGSIIGVTSAIISPAGANAGIGFAIPSAVVVKVVPALIAKGRYEHAYLGLVGVSMSPELAKAMGLQEDQRGALVVDVVPGSPSDKAGLRGSDRRLEVDGAEARVGGDVVVALGNKPTRSFDDLVTELARVGEVGKSLSLTVLRGGKQQQLSVQLTARPAKRGGDDQPQPTAGAAADGVKLGVVASTLTPTLAKAMALKDDQKGVLVQQVEHGGAADRAGLKGSFKPLPGRQRLLVGGDVIVALNSQPVTDMESLQAGLAKLKAGDSATLTVLREGKRQDLKASFSKADQE